MENIIVVLIVLMILVGAVTYIYKSKKSGNKCIGCPYGKTCGGGNCGKK